MPVGSGRIQFIVSGPFLLLLILSTGFFIAGFWLYTHQPPPVLPPSPPFYISRAETALRPCFQCVGPDGKLKPQSEWRLGKIVDIPQDEHWWFAPIWDHEQPINIDNIPMLAVHPAANKERPWYGFDQHRVFFAVLQDLEPRFALEHPAPPPPQPTPAPAAPATADAPASIPQP